MPGDPGRARVLIVDDNRLDREISLDALQGQTGDPEVPLALEACGSAEAALSALKADPADLVISDLTMPGMSGLGLLEQIRREHPGTDFLLVTANASVDSAVAALRLGAIDYLRKPVQPEEFALVVQRALARRRLLRENLRLRGALATVQDCRALIRCVEPGEIYAMALDLVLGALGRSVGVALFKRPSSELSGGIVVRGLDEADTGALKDLLLREKPVALDAWSRIEVVSGGPVRAALRKVGIEPGPLLVLPILGEQEAGVLWVSEEGRDFDDVEIERARIVVGHGELSLRNAERYSRAQERAFRDDVTDLYNARYLHDATEHEIQRAERYEKQLSVLFLDLDRFKLVNDHHGHLVGSQALRQLGQVLTRCVRTVDTVSRYGGDEFTILLVDNDLGEAARVAERIRRTVQDTPFDGGEKGVLRLTVSIGVAAYPQHGTSRETLLDLADKAMYRAKSIGRNRVCTASELGL